MVVNVAKTVKLVLISQNYMLINSKNLMATKTSVPLLLCSDRVPQYFPHGCMDRSVVPELIFNL